MHPAAYEFVREHVDQAGPPVLEFGAIDINGNARALFPVNWNYLGVDEIRGRNVDVVAENMNGWEPPTRYFTVVCTEVLEHRQDARALFLHMAKHAEVLILTCAGEGRLPHARDGSGPAVPPDEHYANIKTSDMQRWVEEAGFLVRDIRHLPAIGDLHVFARRARV